MDSKQVPVTVLMPTYNACRYLKESIDSVLKQTFRDFELLIVDDGSSDRTKEIISEYDDTRIRLVECPHRGLGATLCEGVELASGEYIARMDADDRSYPNRLEIQKKHLQINPSCALVHGCVDIIDSKGDLKTRQVGYVADSVSTKWRLIWKNAIIHSSVMLRKRTLRENNLNYRPELKSSEDYDLWNRIALAGDIETVGGSVLQYREHDKNFTKKNEKDFHFDYFAQVLSDNFHRYGIDLDKKEIEELAILSEHTKIDPRTHRYTRIVNTLLERFFELRDVFCRWHNVDQSALANVQSHQLVRWARYMAGTSKSSALHLLKYGYESNTKILLTVRFWITMFYVLSSVQVRSSIGTQTTAGEPDSDNSRGRR